VSASAATRPAQGSPAEHPSPPLHATPGSYTLRPSAVASARRAAQAPVPMPQRHPAADSVAVPVTESRSYSLIRESETQEGADRQTGARLTILPPREFPRREADIRRSMAPPDRVECCRSPLSNVPPACHESDQPSAWMCEAEMGVRGRCRDDREVRRGTGPCIEVRARDSPSETGRSRAQ